MGYPKNNYYNNYKETYRLITISMMLIQIRPRYPSGLILPSSELDLLTKHTASSK